MKTTDFAFADPGASDQQYPKPIYAWYVVIVLLFTMIISLVDRMVISLLVVPIQLELGLSDVDMGWILGVAFGLFYSIMGLPLGTMADRFHRIHLIAAGIFIWSLMTIASGLSESFWALFFSRMGVGVGEAVLGPAAWSLISDLFPPHRRGRALSVFQLGAVSGVGLGYLMGGFVFQLAESPGFFDWSWFSGMAPWRIVFILAGIPGFVFMLLVLLIKEPRVGKVGASVPAAQTFDFLVGSGRALLPLFTGMASVMLTFYAFNSWVPAILTRQYGISSGEIGQYMGILVLLFGGSAIYLGGWITDIGARKNKNNIYVKVMIVSAMGIIPSIILFAQSRDLEFSLLFIASFVFFAMLPNGVVVAYVNRVTPPRMRGLVGAVYILFCNLFGYMIGPSAVPMLSENLFGGGEYVAQSLAVVGASFGLLALVLFVSIRQSSLTMIASNNMATT